MVKQNLEMRKYDKETFDRTRWALGILEYFNSEENSQETFEDWLSRMASETGLLNPDHQIHKDTLILFQKVGYEY
jgi:hypothetical protein